MKLKGKINFSGEKNFMGMTMIELFVFVFLISFSVGLYLNCLKCIFNYVKLGFKLLK